ncbi:MAG: hypothetical protein KGK11_03140 [Sphingomonadales bacterium]|nr:hypothetical protein [Sphingomonadales bacterium]
MAYDPVMGVGEPTVRAGAAERLLDGLAEGEAAAQAIAPMLRLRLGHAETGLFDEAVIAGIRGMLRDLAEQLLADAGDAPREPALDALERLLSARPGLLDHLHALALEARAAERLQARLRLDPVVSPLLQALIAAPEPETAAAAMHLLAAEARFLRQQQQMRLPVAELPAELFDAVLDAARGAADVPDDAQAVAHLPGIRAAYDEAATRIALADRLVVAMGAGAVAAGSLAHAGVPLFLAALSAATGEARGVCVLALQPGQGARLALLLRKAGVKREVVQASLLLVDAPPALVEAIAGISPAAAAAMLAGSTTVREPAR